MRRGNCARNRISTSVVVALRFGLVNLPSKEEIPMALPILSMLALGRECDPTRINNSAERGLYGKGREGN